MADKAARRYMKYYFHSIRIFTTCCLVNIRRLKLWKTECLWRRLGFSLAFYSTLVFGLVDWSTDSANTKSLVRIPPISHIFSHLSIYLFRHCVFCEMGRSIKKRWTLRRWSEYLILTHSALRLPVQLVLSGNHVQCCGTNFPNREERGSGADLLMFWQSSLLLTESHSAFTNSSCYMENFLFEKFHEKKTESL